MLQDENSKSAPREKYGLSVLKETWRLLNSYKLAITLLSIIALVSFIGVVIPQNLPANAYIEKFAGLSVLIRAFGLNDIFHTNWFTALLVFLAFDILLCIARRVVALVRYYRMGSSLWTRKLGSVILHLSIILILLGGMVSGMRGFRTRKTALQGDTISIPGTNATLRLNRFEVEKTEDGAVKQYRSEVSLIEQNGNSTDYEIMVNHPLSHEGVNVFQNSYGQQSRQIESACISIIDSESGEQIAFLEVPFKNMTKVDGTDLSVAIKDFACDFVIDVHTGTIDNRSPEHRNPAVL
ncbi:MAG: cytochrome c biogenesis protein ResB, partial [bacterium]